MALPPSGPITMGMINVELGRPATQIISLNEASVRALAQVPAGMISLSNFYGKSATGTLGWSIGFFGAWPSFTGNAGPTWEFNMANDTGQNIPVTSPTGTQVNGAGNAGTKSFSKGTPSIVSLTATVPMFSFSFSTKTFSAIASATITAVGAPGVPKMATLLTQTSRIQTANDYYILGRASSPGPTANSTQRWSKFNFSSEVFTVKGQQYTVIAPAPANEWTDKQVSWPAAKVYGKAFQGASSGNVQMEWNFPTDTGSVTFGGSPDYSLGSGGQSSANCCIQNSERGYLWGPNTGIGTTLTTSMGRLVFSSKTYNRTYQSMGTPTARAWFMGLQTPTNGYFLGGTSVPPATPNPLISETHKYVFGTETISLVPSTMPARNIRPYELQSASVLG